MKMHHIRVVPSVQKPPSGKIVTAKTATTLNAASATFVIVHLVISSSGEVRVPWFCLDEIECCAGWKSALG